MTGYLRYLIPTAVFLAALLILGAVRLPAPHPGGDNAGYLTLANSLVEGTGYRELWDPTAPLHTKYPPVYPLALAALILAGTTSWSAFKLFSLVCTAGAIFFVYEWAAARRGAVAGAAVAVLTLFSYGWLDASRWILSEPLFLLLTFAALRAGEGSVGWGVTGTRDAQGRSPSPEGREAGPTAPAAEPPSTFSSRAPLLIAGAATLLAFLTRSAGLPLVASFLAHLALQKRYRGAAVFAGVFATIAGWWFLRARGNVAEGAYASEFWMVNPYEPELGEIGLLGLPLRVLENLRIYLFEVLPAQWWGGVESAALLLPAILLGGGAIAGWILSLREQRLGLAELFSPLYAGLILLWPPVWSGERFLLPLVPIALLLAGEAVFAATARMRGEGGRGHTLNMIPLYAGFLLLALPALSGWGRLAEVGAGCRRVAEAGDPIACYGPGIQEFRDAAVWTGSNLPEGAVVLNRRPRVYYIFGGQPGVTFPFTTDPELFLAEADRVGARYLLLDHLDGVSAYYLPQMIQARPLAFCYIRGWGEGTQAGLTTELVGILPPEERRSEGSASEIEACGAEYRRASPGLVTEPAGGEIPILVR